MKIRFSQDCELLVWNNTWTTTKPVVYKKDDEIDVVLELPSIVDNNKTNFSFDNGNVLWDVPNDLFTEVK